MENIYISAFYSVRTTNSYAYGIFIYVLPWSDWTQSNLPIADILYSRHLVIADTFSWNRPNHCQILIEKSLYRGYIVDTFLVGNRYSGHNFFAPREQFKSNFPGVSGDRIFFVLKQIICYSIIKSFYLTHFSTFTFSKLSTFIIVSYQ